MLHERRFFFLASKAIVFTLTCVYGRSLFTGYLTNVINPTAAAMVIRQATERVADVNKRALRGKAMVERNILHSPQSLLNKDAAEKAAAARRAAVRARAAAEMKAKRAAREVQEAEKVVARANNACRVCRTRVRRGGWSWMGCPCEAFWVCPVCYQAPSAGLVLAEHCEKCSGEVRPVQVARSSGGGPSSA